MISSTSSAGSPTRSSDPSEHANEGIGKKRKRELEEKVSTFTLKRQKIAEEEQKLQSVVHWAETLKNRNEAVGRLSHDSQYIANCAYNEAERQGLKGNVLQIAIEVSKQLNALSIISPDPLRNTDTFKAAQKGKDRNGHIVARIRDLIPQIFNENAQALKHANQQVQKQKKLLEDEKKEIEELAKDQDLTSTDLLDDFNLPSTEESVGREEGDPFKEYFKEATTVGEFIKNMYIRNEDKAKAKHPSDLKLEIAKEIASELCRLANDVFMRDLWIHQIYNAMDKSDQRWHNDVCGEIHLIIFGQSTDAFAYKDKGLKKAWRHVNTPFKSVLSWLNEHYEGEGRLTVGIQANSTGEKFFGPSTNPQLFRTSNHKPSETYIAHYFPLSPQSSHGNERDEKNEFEAKQPSPKEENHASDSPKHSTSDNQDQSSCADLPTQKANPSNHTQTPTDQTQNLPLQNIKNGLNLLDAAQKKFTGYSGLGKISTAIQIAEDIKELGPSKASWNGAVDTISSYAAGKVPFLGIATTISQTYNDNIPKDQACQLQKEHYQTVKEHNSTKEPSMWEKMAEAEAFQGMNDCQNADETLRFPSEANKKITGFLKYKKPEGKEK